ncbi:FecR family protein [Brucellaceae bacterium C25G]
MPNNNLNQNDILAYRDPDPVMDQALDWFILIYASDNTDEKTQIAFQRWLDAKKEHQIAWNELSETWADPNVVAASSALNTELMPNVNMSFVQRSKHNLAKYWRETTLCMSIVFGSAMALPALYAHALIAWQSDFQTSVGQIKEITLPDGSSMILDAQSAVALNFDGTHRGIHLLKGQAWFDVVHDASHPFRVTANFSEVTVKGTAFNVDTGEEKDVVALERGRVEVSSLNDAAQSSVLLPGEMITASASKLSDISSFNPDETSSWKSGWVIFSDKPLRNALAEINQYYAGKIFILNRSLADIAVSGSYRIDNIDAALDGIAAAAGGKITRFPGGLKIIR